MSGKAQDELRGIGAYNTSPRRRVGDLVHEKAAKKTRINQKKQREPAWHGGRRKKKNCA